MPAPTANIETFTVTATIAPRCKDHRSEDMSTLFLPSPPETRECTYAAEELLKDTRCSHLYPNNTEPTKRGDKCTKASCYVFTLWDGEGGTLRWAGETKKGYEVICQRNGKEWTQLDRVEGCWDDAKKGTWREKSQYRRRKLEERDNSGTR